VRLPSEWNIQTPGVEGVRAVNDADGVIEFEIGSGNYHFTN
jgi:hypothetical protein